MDEFENVLMIFEDYWSLSPDNFNNRCRMYCFDPQEKLKKWIDLNLVREIALGHIEKII